MHAGVGLVMIGLLEDLVGADARRLDRGIAGVVQRGGVDVHAADLAVADLDRIDRPHALGDELGAVATGARRRPGSSACGPCAPGPRPGPAGRPRLSVRRTASGLERRKRAVQAIVRATAAHVQRREEHDAVAVDVALQLPGGLEDLLDSSPRRRPPAARPSPRPARAPPWPCSWRSRRASSSGAAGCSSRPCNRGLVDEVVARFR